MYYQNPDNVSVHSGFPNPAADSTLQNIDLNRVLVQHSASTYFMRIHGNAWAHLGIFAGDLAIVDRALAPKANHPVAWVKDGEFALSPKHKLPQNAMVWGVVTSVVHQYNI